jgi:CRP-like cAMP-binding protein
VPKHLHGKIREYFSFLWSYDIEVNESEDDVLAVLPTSLRKEVALSVNGALVQRVPLFVGMSADATFDMITYLRRRIHLPKDIIYKQGREAREFFMLLRGTVWIYVLTEAVAGAEKAQKKAAPLDNVEGEEDDGERKNSFLHDYVHIGTRDGEGTFFGETALSKISASEQRHHRQMRKYKSGTPSQGDGHAGGHADGGDSSSNSRSNSINSINSTTGSNNSSPSKVPRKLRARWSTDLTNEPTASGQGKGQDPPTMQRSKDVEGGRIAGWHNLLHNLPHNVPLRTTTARAQQYCDVLVLTREDFIRVMDDHPTCASQMHHLIEREVNVTLQTAASKVSVTVRSRR